MTTVTGTNLRIEIPIPKESSAPQQSKILKELPSSEAIANKQIKKIRQLFFIHANTEPLYYHHDRKPLPIEYYVDPIGFPLQGNMPMRRSVAISEDFHIILLSREIEPLEYTKCAIECLDFAIKNNLAPHTFFLRTIADDPVAETPAIILFQNYLDGKSLQQMIGWEYNRINEDIQRRILISLLNAFHFLHKNKIFLRALTPNDIFFWEPEGRPPQMRLLDFSYATKISDSSVGLFGSPLYAPPEAKTQMPYCPQKADIFILGLNLYYLFSGDNLNIQIPENIDNPKTHQKAINSIIEHHLSSLIIAHENSFEIPIFPIRFASILKAFLKVDPIERLNASDALELFCD